MENLIKENLVKAAKEARKNSYSPYSGFMVGAALLGKSGEIYRGCNIENAAYSPSLCAERNAFGIAIARGEREFVAIAVAGWAKDKESGEAAPCGVCRQFMMEFCCPREFQIIIVGEDNTSYTLEELLPFGFGPDDLRD